MLEVQFPEVRLFYGGENVCVHSLCMGVGVRTALLAFTQLSNVTEGFKLCWRTGQKLTLNPCVFTYLLLHLAYHEKNKIKNESTCKQLH